MSREKGQLMESRVSTYLKKAGLKWIQKNYIAPYGEIDLIFKEADCLVFVEVRMRTSSCFGGAIESITQSKRAKLIKTAEHYLVANNKYDKMACRFDVVCLDGSGEIEWIKDAFGVE